MATCPECDADMEVDEFDVDKGDLISCPECGSNLEVTSLLAARARTGRRTTTMTTTMTRTTRSKKRKTSSTKKRTTRTKKKRTGTSERVLSPADAPRAGAADLERKEAALYGVARGPAVADRRLQRRRRQRLSRLRGDPGARRQAPSASPPTAPAIPSATARWRSAWRGSSGSSTRSSGPTRCRARSTGPTLPTAATSASTSSTPTLTAIARERGMPVVADGSNADDRGDYRPGRQAAREFGVISPLDAAGLTKDEIRELSRRAGLPTWDEPASACLSSRIPYFSEVTDEKLRTIERAESVLRDLGFRICRVRHHDTIARLELGRGRDRPRARARTWPDRRSTASCARSATRTSRSTCAAIGWAA